MDMPLYNQLDIKVAPTELGHVIRLEDAANFIEYDENGDVTLPAGVNLNVTVAGDPPDTKRVISTDTNGNIVIGEGIEQVNFASINKPNVKVGEAENDTIVLSRELTGYALESYVDAADALKADLVSGVIPDSQIPSDVKVRNWGPPDNPIPTSADLVNLTQATVNDRAFVGTDNPYETWYLLALPPTILSNWRQASGGGGGVAGVESVNNQTGPSVTVDLPQFPLVQNALDDKANAADLAGKANLYGATFTGPVNVPNIAATASSTEAVNAKALNDKLTSNLGSTAPAMNGTASAGTATTVARSDHVHPSDTTRAPLASPALTGSPTVGGQPIRGILYGTVAPTATAPEGTVYLVYE